MRRFGYAMMSLMRVYLGFDSHIFDYVLAEPMPLRGQLIEYVTKAPHQLLVSAVNVLEGACCPTADKRGALLRLMLQLSRGCRPLALAGDLFRREIDAYAIGQVSETVTIAEEQEGLWIGLNAPEEIEQADIKDANRYRAAQECEFRQMYENARPHFQQVLGSAAAKGITSASRLIRHFRDDEEFLKSTVDYFVQVSPLAHRLKGRELEFLQNMPGWQSFFLACAAAVYLRCIQAQHYGHKKNPGYFDVSQAVYLPRCHVYVTHDDSLRKVLRLVAVATRERTQILSYSQFREIVVRGYDPSGWRRFQDKGFRFIPSLPHAEGVCLAWL